MHFSQSSVLGYDLRHFVGVSYRHIPATTKTTAKSGKLILRFKPYELKLKHSFNLAKSSRTTTPDVQVELEYDGIIGYGEASMPPYLGESVESVTKFLSSLDLEQFTDEFDFEEFAFNEFQF